MILSYVIEFSVALGLVAFTFLAVELGFRLGQWRRTERDEGEFPLATVQGATLGLVALLLGFSFSAALTRFVDRQDVILSEANAIGTAYLRADLIEEPHRSAYRQALRDYVAVRIRLFNTLDFDEFDHICAESAALHTQMWTTAVSGVRETGKFDQTVLPPLNEVIDLHETRITKMFRHHPPMVVETLLLAIGIALLVFGYGCGKRGRRHAAMSAGLSLLLALTMWLVLDLDYPRIGLVQISQAPMLDLQKSLQGDSPPAAKD